MKLLAMTLFSVIFLFYDSVAFAADEKPFYKKIDTSTRTKQAFLNKLDNYSEFFQAPEADLLRLVSKNLGIEIKDLTGLKKFISENLDVEVYECDWNNEKEKVKISFVKSTGTNQTYGNLSRVCYNGEYVLIYRGKAFLSLACGNPVLDERVISKLVKQEEVSKAVIQESLIQNKEPVVVEVKETVRHSVFTKCNENRTVILRNKGRALGIQGGSGAGIYLEKDSSSDVELNVVTCN